MESLRGSIFALPEPSRTVHARALWDEIAQSLVSEFGDQYLYSQDWRYRICLRSTAVRSPDGKLIRYRTVEASIRRRSGHRTLLDLSVGNMFSESLAALPAPVHVVTDSRYAVWARSAGQVSLNEHVQLVSQFTVDLMDAGWALETTRLSPFKVSPPKVRNGRGVHQFPTGKFHLMAQNPISKISPGVELVVVWPDPSVASRMAGHVSTAFEHLFRSDSPRVRHSARIESTATNLILLDDRSDLAALPDLRAKLRDAEAAGVRFKLAKLSTITKAYPVQNVAWDLFLISGGRPWVPATPLPAFCSLDAGHDWEGRTSRWVKAESDSDQVITNVQAFDTALAEHIPAEQLNALWPSDATAVLCRDGRLAQERTIFEGRAAREGRSVIEAKKSPKAMLWRESPSGVRTAEFGDAMIDEHGEVLLQTVPQDVRDYIHPIRLSLCGGEPIALATSFLHQHSLPGLSLFKMSRLPGTLYFSDLVSKMTADGWPKAVGRGFRIPQVIP